MNGKQLRNSILQWAIQGKLVPQDPNDEPAAALLRRINPKAVPLQEDVPFTIPDSWCWCRMQDVIEFINGRAYRREELLDKGKYKVLRVGNFFTNSTWYFSDLELPDDKYCYKGDLLYAWSASFGPQIWNGDKTIFHYHIWNVKYNPSVLYRDYLYYFLLYDKIQIQGSTTGSTMVHVSMENMKPRLIPLPPLAEQERIVGKVEELLPLVERYDKAQTELDRLNASLKGKLRASVLQEAISGRLVPQDPTDEPAAALLRRINPKAEPLQEDVPFTIPDSWCWCRLGDIGEIVTGSTPSKSIKEYYEGDIPFFKPSDLEPGINVCESSDHLSEEGFKRARQLPPNSVLVTCIGATIGKTGLTSVFGTCNQQINAIVPNNDVLPLYVYFACVSDYMQTKIKTNASATTLPILNKGNFAKLLIPLPPLAEQERIVGKVEELFAVLDALQ